MGSRRRQSIILNFLTIFVTTLIVVDLVLDIVFIAIHGKDEKWLLPVSVVFLVVPVAVSTLFTFIIISQELTEERYQKWWTRHSHTALITTLLAGLDIEALNVASSRFASYSSLNAPYSPSADRKIFYATAVLLIIEDIPQIIYQKVTIIPAIVPILALSSCIILIIVRVIEIIYLAFFCEKWHYDEDSLDDGEKRGERDSPEEETAALHNESAREVDNRRPPNPPAIVSDLINTDDIGNGIRHPAPFVEADIMKNGKNGKNGKDTSRNQETTTHLSTRPSGTGVGARISDIASDVEGPIGKYTEGQMMELPSDDGHFQTKRTQYTDEEGVTHIKEEVIYVPENTVTTVREETFTQGEPHIIRTRHGDGTETETTTYEEHTYGDAPSQGGGGTPTTETTTRTTYLTGGG
ncbi:9118_t:CDS:2, partial [Gigaspora rosea]